MDGWEDGWVREKWVGGLTGGKQGKGQRRDNSDNYSVRTSIQNATSLETYKRNLSQYFPKHTPLFILLEGK